MKIWTANKLLAKLPVLLAQIKTGNNSYKLKNEIRQTLYLFYQHKITKTMGENKPNNGREQTYNKNRTQNV